MQEDQSTVEDLLRVIDEAHEAAHEDLLRLENMSVQELMYLDNLDQIRDPITDGIGCEDI